MAMAMAVASITVSNSSLGLARVSSSSSAKSRTLAGRCNAVVDKEKPSSSSASTAETEESAEQVTQKYGLEAGLWKIFTSKDAKGQDKKVEAKTLLARYGGAYLATSISLSAVSFAICYVLVSSGFDVAALLGKVGIQTNETSEKVGTLALAYAAHKAASPIRFPPTVALTPVVASWFGQKSSEQQQQQQQQQSGDEQP